MLSGSKEITLKDLTFERATNLAALRLFKCGLDEVDKIIKDDLPSLLPTNDLWLVKDGEEVVALFCLQRDPYCLFLSDDVKEKMKEGEKPKPIAARQEGEAFWDILLRIQGTDTSGRQRRSSRTTPWRVHH